ncbi:dihydrofolate reductase [Candidatus Woesearchaeota archaeon]|nr:dihydrofolate reductase [Candidatus Woesearchaeota archaeon]
MTLSMIWAMDRNNLVGKDLELPWHIPEDLKYFKRTTSGKTVIMGLKTFESLGRPLPNRRNIVLDFQPKVIPGCEVLNSIKEAVAAVKDEEEAFVIGGASIYKQFLKYADRLYVTRIDHEFEGNIYFPEVNWDEWKEISREKGVKDENNHYDYYFVVYERK